MIMSTPTERSLRPPPISGSSNRSKGKEPVRVNPQFEAYHNPYKIMPEPELSVVEYYIGETGWWLKPLALVATIALMVAFVVFCPPPGYESSGGHKDPGPIPNFTVQPDEGLKGGDETLHPEVWVEAPRIPNLEDDEAQRVFRIVHRPR